MFVKSDIEQKKENETEEDYIDRKLKYSDKLFGNMDFVGELYKELLVSETILYSIFETLLDINSPSISDTTIDAALQLMNKLGSKMEHDANSKKKEEAK